MISILCLVGSTTTQEMAELSELYARGCIDALGDRAEFEFSILHRSPDGVWKMPTTLDPEDIRFAEPMAFADAVASVSRGNYDLGLPQMFCPIGMTTGRSLFELLDMPFIGNRPLQMGLTADKAMARAIVSAAGIDIPDGLVVRPGEALPDLPDYPLVVKPVSSDNSDGLSLITSEAGLPSAIALAHLQGDALVERFIPPGRELRCGVIDWGGELRCLPPEEYPLDKESHPIRTKGDKLGRDSRGQLSLVAKTADAAWIVDADDPIIPALHEASLRAYRALGCRHYGLFDFRVDDDGRVWFLEAGLYCSFSPQSVICVMAKAAGIDLHNLFRGFAEPILKSEFRAATAHAA